MLTITTILSGYKSYSRSLFYAYDQYSKHSVLIKRQL